MYDGMIVLFVVYFCLFDCCLLLFVVVYFCLFVVYFCLLFVCLFVCCNAQVSISPHVIAFSSDPINVNGIVIIIVCE